MKNVQFIGLCLGGDFNDFQQFSIEHVARNVAKLGKEAVSIVGNSDFNRGIFTYSVT